MSLVVIYHPRCHDLGRIYRKTFIYLYGGEELKQRFTSALFALFRSCFNLRNHFVQVKVYLLLREKEPSCCGKSRCGTCSNLSFVTEKIDKINHDFDCHSRCIVYLLSCKVCGLQYVVSPIDRFIFRRNNYKCSIGRGYCQAELLPSTFLK